MASKNLTAHYTRLLRLWPVDRLRPTERHFQRLLENRTQHPRSEAEVNAAYLLIDNSISNQFKLSDKTMKPASDPMHYENLSREIDEAPDRGWFGRVMKRLGGMVRMK